jgi:5-methylcytosine-specific restriction enzyme B
MRVPWCLDAVYDLATHFREKCLISDGSLFTDRSDVTTLENMEALEAVVGQEDHSDRPFMAKLVDQVSELVPAQVLLIAELLLVQLMGENDTGGATKRQHIDELLERVGEQITLPDAVIAAIDGGGVARYAAGKNRRDAYLRFLVRTVGRVKALDEPARRAVLTDPWAFQALVAEERTSVNGMQANALLHLLFPDTFECVISGTHRAPLLETFADAPGLGDLPDDDRKIDRLRDLVVEQTGYHLNFYDEPVERVWRESDVRSDEFAEWADRLYQRPEFDATERDYKLALAKDLAAAAEEVERGHDWVPALRRVLTGAGNNLTSWRTNEALLDWCAEESAAARDCLLKLWEGLRTDEDWDQLFGDFFAALPADRMRGAGTRVNLASVLALAADAENTPPFRPSVYAEILRLLQHTAVEPEADEPTEIAMWGDWIALNQELRLRLLARGRELRDMLDSQSLLYWMASGEVPDDWDEATRQAFARYRGAVADGHTTAVGASAPPTSLPAATPELADALTLPLGWVQETLDLLQEKRQLILYGPPGTGKTFLAQHLARHLQSAGGTSRLVQFHPSYTYEDFFEGYRPETNDDGQLSYKLVPGPLRRLAAAAELNSSVPHLLVIDEINRGNLPRIFGELYFLLEYRDSEIELQYSPDSPFKLPRNLFVIGTMNTADRSIALIDSALRRRFYFRALNPVQAPIAGVLRSWLERKSYDPEPADLLAALNLAIGDEDFAIGPSYFMTERDPAVQLEHIWENALMPLLEEHFYGSGRAIHDDFGLAALRRRLDEEAAVQDLPVASPATDESPATDA